MKNFAFYMLGAITLPLAFVAIVAVHDLQYAPIVALFLALRFIH
jgi:hypothetical protein